MSTSAPIVLTLLLLVGIAASAWRYLRRRHNALAQAKPAATPDGLRIPVNGIESRGGTLLGGSQRNSLSPRFTIGTDSIHIKVVSSWRLPYSDIARVDVRPRRNGWVLLFVSRASGSVVYVDVIGEATALAALRALPDDLAYTAQAARLREGSEATATAGLRPDTRERR